MIQLNTTQHKTFMNACLYTIQEVYDVSGKGCDTTRSATTMKMKEHDINGTT